MKLFGMKPSTVTLSNGKTVEMKRSQTPFVVLLLVVLTIAAGKLTGFNIVELFERLPALWVILEQLFSPNFAYANKLWIPLLDTIKMSFIGSALGALLALPMAYLASSNMISNRFVVSLSKFFLSVLRTLPTLIVASIATFILGLGTMAGTVAIFMFTIAYVGKLLYEQIENADMKAYDAMLSVGMTPLQSFRYAILPQVLPSHLSTALFSFEGNVRYASILGLVGAGGIGLMLNENIGWRNYSNVGMILLLLMVTVIVIETISETLRKKLI